jgi:hypothetical protein
MTRTSGIRMVGFLLITLLLTGAVLLSMVEAGLRFKGTFANHLLFNTPPGPDGHVTFDAEFGHLRLPGRIGTVHRSEYNYEVRSNSMGFRDEELLERKSSNEYRVMVLGDSIAAGYGVMENERFTELIEGQVNSEYAIQGRARPVLRMINAAIGGHGTIQSRMVFEHYADGVKPDAVLLAFSTTNDFQNNRKVFRWKSGHEEYYLNGPPPNPVTTFLRDHFHIYHLLGALKNWKSGDGAVDGIDKSLTEEALGLIRKECDRQEIPFTVALMTTHNSYALLDDPEKRESDSYKTALEILKAGRFQFIDTIQALRNDPELNDLYYMLDTHPNARGHKRLAEILLQAGLLTDEHLGAVQGLAPASAADSGS